MDKIDHQEPATFRHDQNYDSWFTLEQQIPIDDYAGKRFRVQAATRILSADSPHSYSIFAAIVKSNSGRWYYRDFQAHSNTDWQVHTITGEISENGNLLLIQLTSNFNGRFLYDAVQLEIEVHPGIWQRLPLLNGGFETEEPFDSPSSGWKSIKTAPPEFQLLRSDRESYQGRHALLVEAAGITDPGSLIQAIASAPTEKIQLEKTPIFDYLYLSPGVSSKNRVFDITQDKLGHIWVATFEGLAKYNGGDFRFYKYPGEADRPCQGTVHKIFDIQEDTLWLSLDCGLLLFDLKKEQFFRHPVLEDQLPLGYIEDIVKDDEEEIWISVLRNLGSFRYNPATREVQPVRFFTGPPYFETLQNNLEKVQYIGNGKFFFRENFQGRVFIYDKYRHAIDLLPLYYLTSPVAALTAGKNGDLWIATKGGNRGLSRINFEQHQLYNYREKGFTAIDFERPERDFRLGKNVPYIKLDSSLDLSSNTVNEILYTSNDQVYVATQKGLQRFIPEIHGFQSIQHQSSHPQSSAGNQINCLFEDRDGNIWVGTEAGIRVHWQAKKPFYYQAIEVPKSFYGHRPAEILGIEALNQRQLLLWNTTDFYLFDRHSKNITNLRMQMPLQELLQDYPISYVKVAADGTLWIGTHFIYAPGNYTLFHYDLQQRELIAKYYYGNGLSKYNTTAIVEDRGSIWIGTRGGLNRLNPDGSIDQFLADEEDATSLSDFYINCLYIDYAGDLWIGTPKGLNKYDREHNCFMVYQHDLSDSTSISNNEVYSIQEDTHNRLWIGTKHGLNIFDPQSESFQRFYNYHHGEDRNIFRNLVKDEACHFWIGQFNGLVRFDPESLEFTNFNEQDGLGSSLLNGGYKAGDGTVYFGGATGLLYFNPNEIDRKNQIAPQLVITDFLVAHELITPTTHPDLLKQHISYSSSIVLKHWQNNITIRFAALDFTNPSQNQYAYQLEGFDKRRQEVGNSREVDYTNLPPGNYTFKVIGSNNDGLWSASSASLQITVLAPWYWSKWSIPLYGLLVVGGIIWFFYFLMTRKEAERLKELNEEKSRLYTNLTHEFRTPLTIITGMAEKIRTEPQKWLDNGLGMISRNGQLLLRQVNQMLELSRIESGNWQSNPVQGDIVGYTRYVVESFQSFAAMKPVHLHMKSWKDRFILDFDPDHLLTILSNLISNAVKFTPAGGDVTVNILQTDQRLILKVQDSGIGIPAEKLPYLFDRFYQVDNSETRAGEGTGIGLALVKELVDRMQGEIKVQSQPGVGTTFSVDLPIQNKAPVQSQMDKTSIIQQLSLYTAGQPITGMRLTPSVRAEKDQPTVLLVEDNQDVLQYLIACLEEHYQIEVANDGAEGIARTFELMPDLIISDVMMPNKSGLELCDTLKNDMRSSHIPIILLTAKVDTASKLSGLRHGADAYLTKPFHEEELFIRLEQLLRLRKQLFKKFQSEEYLTRKLQPEAVFSLSLDEQFIIRLRNIINAHIGNSQLDVSLICREIGIARTPLHNKLKALTGMSATEFVRFMRINKAKELLVNTEKNISLIAYEVGFRNHNYFSKIFRAQTSSTPSEYRDLKQ